MVKGNRQKINSTVVYTAAFGSNVFIVPQKQFAGVDFILFTDYARGVKGWKEVIVDLPFPADPALSNRFFKIQPHLFLQKYERSIYIDSNYIVMNIPADNFDREMNGNDMLVFSHNETISDKRNCVYKEFDALAYAQRGNEEMMNKHRQFLIDEGYPADNGLITAAVLIRNHMQTQVIQTMELWWKMVFTMVRRDQLSFNYAAWKTGLQLSYLKGDIRRGNPYFYHVGKSDSNMWFSLLKFRLRKLKGHGKQG